MKQEVTDNIQNNMSSTMEFEELRTEMDKIEAEFKHKGYFKFELCVEVSYEMPYVEVYGTRLETDEEEIARIAYAKKQQERIEAGEIEQFKALKIKYEQRGL